MTSGTKTTNTRKLVSTSCGNAYTGYYAFKSWSGTDNTAARPPKPPVGPPTAYTRWRRTRKGEWVSYIAYHKQVPPRPPKRARGVGEHPYTCYIEVLNEPMVAWRWTTTPPAQLDYTGTVGGCWGGFSATNPWTPNDDIKLVLKLKEVMQGTDFDPSVAMGGGMQNVDMITSSAQKIYKAWRNVRNGNYEQAAKDLAGVSVYSKKKQHLQKNSRTSADAASAAWLELQYGWRPLIQDAYDAATFLAHQLSAPVQQTFRARHRVNGVVPLGTNIRPMFALNQARGQIVARISEMPSVPKLLGLQNPENVAWELVPYSFVADWFLPIGDFLAARSFAQGLQGTFITTKTSTKEFGGVVGINTTIVKGGEGYRSSVFNLTRTVSSSLSVPMPNVKPLGQSASWQHAANAVGLVTQMFSKR